MSWTGPEFRDALMSACQARPHLTGLTPRLGWYPYDPGLAHPESDFVAMGNIADTQDYAALGTNPSEEDVTIESLVWVWRPGVGDAVAAAASDRCLLVLDQIHQQLRDDHPRVGRQTITAKVARRMFVTRPFTAGTTGGMVAVVEFDINYRARID